MKKNRRPERAAEATRQESKNGSNQVRIKAGRIMAVS